MIETILWDVDGTLLDFAAAEAAAIRRLFAEHGLGDCTEEMLRRYSAINKRWWERLERGEVTRMQVLEGRFREFFTAEGLDASAAPAFNARYQVCLGDTIVYRDDSLAIVRALRGRVRQYAVSNGTVVAQEKKLRLSGLGALMDGVFLSEELGVEKPDPAFFDKVFAAIGPVDRRTVLIVGDSRTSDIRGGLNAGIRTCWYAPEGGVEEDGMQADHVIRDLHQIFALL